MITADVRVTALNAIVELVKADGRSEDLNFLLDIIENDPEPRVRHQLLLMLAQHPPFERGRGHPLDTTSVMERLWKLMKYAIIVIYCEFQMMTFFLFFCCYSVGLSHDSRLRNDIVDLYHCLYGRRKPPCLSGAIYQRVAQAPPTALESAEVITGLSRHVMETQLQFYMRLVLLLLCVVFCTVFFFVWITGKHIASLSHGYGSERSRFGIRRRCNLRGIG